ncbi:tubulin-like doman-containing protein [Leifsonia sp. Leaf264]|uniref:tubulin-like doman-containing protein n=1 Tax=Leifsonia sp. Leaf264 TaxID=1736314 RepID=UPI0006F7323B|nr:tubulin-like doman-containing protein [Leifsonia sp. Leaf264]KQO99627.1 hypothetical protein ASF30_06855 [Leifsonia sp. Leaf264]
MLRPFLIIGVGGSGGKTLRGLRHALELRLQKAGWTGGLPTAWQMLHIDTPVSQDGTDYVYPFLPPENYLGLVSSGASYETVYGSVVHGGRIAADVEADVRRQLPDASRVPVTVAKGAGQFRAVGRTVVLSKLGDVSAAARNAINRMTDANALGQLETLGEFLGAKPRAGVTPSPTVIVASSVAGGSGAGQYLDVIETVKEVAKSEDWAYNFFSLLFAPDVFDQVKGSAGIPSNALAAITETMSGFWTRDPSASTMELFRARGLQPSYGGARDRVGAAYPFIVGRQNSKVAFANQSEVYSAVSTSVSAWMTDDKVQGDLDEYAITNWTANVGANVLADNTRLMSQLDQTPPFSSIGFGRVTLGRERFLDYAGERFARSVVDQMLYAHMETDKLFKERTQTEWIEHRASQVIEGFIKESGLDEEREESNDVIDALRATTQLDALADELRNALLTKTSDRASLDKTGGLSASDWADRLLVFYSSNVGRYLEQDRGNRGVKLREWINTQPGVIIAAVERSIAQRGLAVTVELLSRLSRTVKAASDQLLNEAEQHRGWERRLSGLVNESLASAPNVDSIRPDNDALADAIDRAVQGFEWQSEASLRDSASQLLTEVRADFLEPLREMLAQSLDALRGHVKERTRADGRENDYDFWPERGSSTVPRKYEPAPNERLLVEHTAYPAEFDRLVLASSLESKTDNAMLDIMEQVLLGTPGDVEVESAEPWHLLDYRRTWVPSVTASIGERATDARRPKFAFANEPSDYVTRAKNWMLRPGTAFEAYIREDIRGYFDEDALGANEYKQRKDRFREQLQAALGSSEPLVKLNPSLLSEVHGKALGDGIRTVFSSIPFAVGTDLYDITKSVLAAQGLWDENVSPGWFKDAKVDSVEIFAMLGFPYQPIVMDSIMAPIAKSWMVESNSPESRAAFWKWKRARLLRESAPASPEVFDAMVRGWFAAKTLSLLAVQGNDAIRGPKIEIWDVARKRNAAFPHPLLHPDIALSNDFVGVVMESLTVALALCNADGSLAPLHAYHQLLDLGGTDRQLAPVLNDWIRNGVMPASAAHPQPERAGAAGDSWAVRKAAVLAFLADEKRHFETDVVEQDSVTSVYTYPVSWEIRGTVVKAIDDLVNCVSEMREERSGV